MTFASRAAARIGKLPRADTTDVLVERDIEAKMPDGAILLADRWYAPATVGSDPVVLLRCPYGRRQLGIIGRLMAERGYQVVIQSVRGTFGSGGDFDPFHHERDDGLATYEWIASQPWFTGRIGTYGPSYLGLTQWATLSALPEYVKAMSLQVTAAKLRDCVVYPGESFSLETGAVWVHQMEYQERGAARFIWALLTARKRLERAYTTLPLRDADTAALGRRIPFYQEWLVHELPGDSWWEPLDFTRDAKNAPPSSHLSGWYDVFLLGQLADYTRMREAGRDVRLTIGPWTHTSPGAGAAGIRDGLEWFDVHLKEKTAPRGRDRVRIHVMGRDRWVDLPEWPPPSTPERWHLQPGAGLSSAAPSGGAPDRYRYDPADPTPGLGGATLDPLVAGPKDQAKREQRADVRVYSSSTLTSDVTIAGPLEADLWVKSSRPFFDVFVRLCDVDQKGKSRNISDGLLRIGPDSAPAGADGVYQVRVRMGPTAMMFKAGHRIRLQISSAAHPLYARNTGSGDRLASASELFTSDHEILHDPDHPSAVILPISDI